MKPCVMLYVDAPQHFRIASALIGALGDAADVSLITPIPVPATFDPGRCAHVRHIEAPALAGWSRPLRALLRGVAINAGLRAALERPPSTLVVFNDTGVAQRYLIRLGRRRGAKTVLVQDGLTEIQHREGTWAFRLKRLVTAAFLEPLGLMHYGTSRYGCAGAAAVLADGPPSVRFFSERGPRAAVFEAGFIRPEPALQGAAARPWVLFWAVDFLGGLGNRALHEQQLRAIVEIGAALAAAGSQALLRVRLHPGDSAYAHEYAARLGGLGNVEITQPSAEPFADGRPLAALSLQSAGVFDSLAAHIPSFFLSMGEPALAPAWAPPAIVIGQADCAGLLFRIGCESGFGAALWHGQVRALGQRMLIPFDADVVRAALC